jgi:thioredoxin 1
MVKVITRRSEIPIDKKVVLDFFADWCGPCKKIAPLFSQLSEENPDIVFLKIDVDGIDDLASEFDVKALPTFIFINKNNLTHRIEGSNEGALKATFEKLKNL